MLPDVNVLIALAWPNHVFHDEARRRMERERGTWATCVVTQLGATYSSAIILRRLIATLFGFPFRTRGF